MPSNLVSPWRADFPYFDKNAPVFLDNAASSQKLACVLNVMQDAYIHYANIHRGVYQGSVDMTDRYEAVRDIVRDFIQAKSSRQIVFTKGTTESLNLLAFCLGETHFSAGDELIITPLAHHANIVPWQMLAQRKGARIRVARLTASGDVDWEHFASLISTRTKLITLTHVSNVTGVLNPVSIPIALAKEHGIPVVLDGAQSAGHIPVNMQTIGCDFYVFSGHKMYGPTGVGVLYAADNWLDKLPPYQTGGSMISEVTLSHSNFLKGPQKFEAGTPPIVEVIGLGAAIQYLAQIGMDKIAAYEDRLTAYLCDSLRALDDVTLLASPLQRIATVPFVMSRVHPHDVGTILDSNHVAVRAGHHCAMPLHEALGVPASLRASLGLYNDESDVDALVSALMQVREIFL